MERAAKEQAVILVSLPVLKRAQPLKKRKMMICLTITAMTIAKKQTMNHQRVKTPMNPKTYLQSSKN